MSNTITTEELVRGWKNPDSRTGVLDYHPSGNIDLDAVGGKKDENTISFVTVTTIATTVTTSLTTTSVGTIITTVTLAP